MRLAELSVHSPSDGSAFWTNLCLNGSYVSLHRTAARYFRQASELEVKYDANHPSVVAALRIALDASWALEVRMRGSDVHVQTWRKLVAGGLRAAIAAYATGAIHGNDLKERGAESDG